MLITANGKRLDIQSGMTLHSFLEMRGMKPETVVIEYNYNLPPKETWTEIVLAEGDNLEIIKMMGGG
jgi:sulfur carrier protein